jgi:segregation and condensation protein B
LETFGLRNINELPTLSEIDQLIPEGIGEPQEEKQTLSDLTGQLSTEVAAKTYSEGEDELLDISGELKAIQTTTDFFENEKRRQKEKRDADRAQDIQERLAVGEAVEEKDKRWLARYELELAAKNAAQAPDTNPTPAAETEVVPAIVSEVPANESQPIEPS